MKQLFKVLAQTEPMSINTQNGPSQKSTVILQELGGKFENSYAATLLGNQVKYFPGDIVFASLRFSTREYNSQWYQDITIQEILKFA